MAASSSAAHGPTECNCGSCDTSHQPSMLQCKHCVCNKRLGELMNSTHSQHIVCPTCGRFSPIDAVIPSPLPAALSSLQPLDCCDVPIGHSGYKCSTCTAEMGVEFWLGYHCKEAHDMMHFFSSHRLEQEPSLKMAPEKIPTAFDSHRVSPTDESRQGGEAAAL